MPPQKTEHTEQVRFITWFRSTYPGVLIFAVPNAGQRANGFRYVAEGLVAGVPDLFIPAWRLWIEMKLPGGRVSPAQKQIMANLSEVGYTCAVCYGFEDACNRANLHFNDVVIHKYQNEQ